MKKYRVTEKHGILKEGLMLEPLGGCHYKIEDVDICYQNYFITDWLKGEWIKEIQEPEFTKDNMKKFAISYYNARYKDNDTFYIEDYFQQWIKKLNK